MPLREPARGDGLPTPRWALRPLVQPEVLRALDMPRLWAQLLYNRGLEDPEQAHAFLHVSRLGLHDPFLLPDMGRAVHRIERAIEAGETIAVFGDFDTDGVTATVLLYQGLERLGARAIAYIPHRVHEGHGLNGAALAQLRERGASLIVTVDTGITAVDEVAEAKRAGLDVIITDHHVPGGVRPAADAIVSCGDAAAGYPFPHLTGAGLAFKLVQALDTVFEYPLDERALEMAALGTVADRAPLLGENRVLAKEGLEAIRHTPRPGLLGLLSAARMSATGLDHETIPFVISPRINAAGRMDTADLSFRLLTATENDDVQEMAAQLERLNGQRQRLTRELIAGALPEASRQAAAESLLMIDGEDYNPGVSGLVAGRLAERFYRPAVVVAVDGGVARASGRSIPEFDLADAFTGCGELFLRFGGHRGAAGFTARTDLLPAIRGRLQSAAVPALRGVSLTPVLHIDAEVAVKDLLGDTFEFLRSLAPFGDGNPPPVFMTSGVEATSARQMGSEGKHLRLTLKENGVTWDAVAFDQEWPASLPRPDRRAGRREPVFMDVAYTIEENRLHTLGTVQLRVLGLRPASGGGLL